MLIVVEHPLLASDLTRLRDRATDATTFRQLFRRVGMHLTIAATHSLDVEPVAVETPLEQTLGLQLTQRIVAVAILRAGLLLLEPFLELVPTAHVGYVGLRRDEATLEPQQYYWRVPQLDEQRAVFVLDPMLATGGSACAALAQVFAHGGRKVTLVCALAAPEGIERVHSVYPTVRIVTAAVDRQLSAQGFILPGLGDAGDRAFGT